MKLTVAPNAQAKAITSAKAIYDYAANGDGELSITEDETLSVYEQEEEWVLVKSNKPGGKAGYVPATYIELVGCFALGPALCLTQYA